MSKYYIVWNAQKTEGFVTTDDQLAYEVRKSAYTNCYYVDGTPAPVAEAFCNQWWDGDCTLEVVDESEGTN